MRITIQSAQLIRDRLSIDLLSLLVDPARTAEVFRRLGTRRDCRQICRILNVSTWHARQVVARAVTDFFPLPDPRSQKSAAAPGSAARLHQGELPIDCPWEWAFRLCGAVGIDAGTVTLRELLHLYAGASYQDDLISARIVAGLFNAKRTKRSAKCWRMREFHPQHHQFKRATGRQQVDHLTNLFMAA